MAARSRAWLDLLAYQVREIEAVSPQAEESERLAAEEARLGHVERLLEAAGTAEAALGGDDGAADALGVTARVLDDLARSTRRRRSSLPGARPWRSRSPSSARDVRSYRESLAPDPQRLQQVRERVGALKALQRKYETDADVVAFMARHRLDSPSSRAPTSGSWNSSRRRQSWPGV